MRLVTTTDAERTEAKYRAAVERHEAARERLRAATKDYAREPTEDHRLLLQLASREADRLRAARSRAHVAARQPGLV